MAGPSGCRSNTKAAGTGRRLRAPMIEKPPNGKASAGDHYLSRSDRLVEAPDLCLAHASELDALPQAQFGNAVGHQHLAGFGVGAQPGGEIYRRPEQIVV